MHQLIPSGSHRGREVWSCACGHSVVIEWPRRGQPFNVSVIHAGRPCLADNERASKDDE